jgi:hypothetical protein
VHTPDRQSLPDPQEDAFAHAGEHAGVAQCPSVQTPEPQSLLAPHTLASGHVGAHEGEAHLPPVQSPVAQSPAPVHACPSGHAGEHDPPAHLPAVQIPERQSPFWPHASPVAQLGEQDAVAHLPLVQVPEPQSVAAPHATPVEQAGAQIGGWQAPELHFWDEQSRSPWQAWPSGHAGLQLDAAAWLPSPLSVRWPLEIELSPPASIPVVDAMLLHPAIRSSVTMATESAVRVSVRRGRDAAIERPRAGTGPRLTIAVAYHGDARLTSTLYLSATSGEIVRYSRLRASSDWIFSPLGLN